MGPTLARHELHPEDSSFGQNGFDSKFAGPADLPSGERSRVRACLHDCLAAWLPASCIVVWRLLPACVLVLHDTDTGVLCCATSQAARRRTCLACASARPSQPSYLRSQFAQLMRGRSTLLLASICIASLLDIGLRTGSLQPAQGIVCDILCQQEQRVALVDIFDSANFHLLDWSDNTTTAAGGLPGHCRWPGVGCCNATGYLYTAGAGPDLDAAFSSLPCNISGAVSLLALPGLGLSGSLPQAAKSWQALGSSMEYLGLQSTLALLCSCQLLLVDIPA